jgi:hypothetical protein
MNAILTIGVAASLLFAWVCIFHVIPNCLLSMFRYRLWRQRDELAAEIRNGSFDRVEAPEELVELMERFIQFAPEFSAVRVTLGRIIEGLSDVPAPREPLLDMSEMVPAEKENLERYLAKFNGSVGDHVLLETPSGWGVVLMGILLLPILIPVALLQLRNDGEVQKPRKIAAEESIEVALNSPFGKPAPQPKPQPVSV